MHVIVGQGQLDDVLHAGPEARRALIEEAAGVLKHRKRKEKALRKLEAMQANLTRLVDLTAELRRRLKPLGRQAEVARRAAVIQAELRDARLRLLADDYVTLAVDWRGTRPTRPPSWSGGVPRRPRSAQATAREAALDRPAQQASTALARAQENLVRAFRPNRTAALDPAPRRQAAPPADRGHRRPERPGRDPDELDRQADELPEQERRPNDDWPRASTCGTWRAAKRTAGERDSPRPSGGWPRPPRRRARRAEWPGSASRSARRQPPTRPPGGGRTGSRSPPPRRAGAALAR